MLSKKALNEVFDKLTTEEIQYTRDKIKGSSSDWLKVQEFLDNHADLIACTQDIANVLLSIKNHKVTSKL